MPYIYRTRIIKNGKYHHIYKNSSGLPVNNKNTIEYIKSLRIAPAYKDVKISLNKNDKVVAIGKDNAGRKQYSYNPAYVIKSEHNKYCGLIDFNKKLPLILKRINTLVKQPVFNKDKLIAIILLIIFHCNFRIGNDKYRIKHQSYGITTISEKQLKFRRDGVYISYIGKRGVPNQCLIKNKGLVGTLHDLHKDNIDRRKYFFTYVDSNNGSLRKRITSNDINEFLHEFGDFTSKDFRTIKANTIFIDEMMKRIPPVLETEAKRRKQINEIIEIVANRLHHTKAICRKSYVLHDLYEMYVEDPQKYLKLFVEKDRHKNTTEHILMRFLKYKCNKKV